jgi:hypothetical protein
MPADIFCAAVDDDINSEIQRILIDGRGKGIVNCG